MMTKRLTTIVLVTVLAGCAAIGNITLPSQEEVTHALQAMFDGRSERIGKAAKVWSPPPGQFAPQVSSLEIKKWKLIEDTYLVADVHVMLTTKGTTAVQHDPQAANFRLLMQRRDASWILLDLVPIAEPQTVQT